MLELTALVLINRLADVGVRPIVATRIIAADPSGVRALLTGPLAQQRIVARVPALARPRTQVLPTRSPRLVQVGIRLRGRDALWLTWILTPRRGTTEVDLAAQVHSHRLVLRLALLLGGRRLIARQLDGVLSDMAAEALHAAEDLDDATAAADRIPRAAAI